MVGMHIGQELKIMTSGTGKSMVKSNEMASTVSHAENCLYDIAREITMNGSTQQREALRHSFAALEELYFTLREDE